MSRKPRAVQIARQSESGWDRGCTIRLVLLAILAVALTALADFGNPTSQFAVICDAAWGVALLSFLAGRRGD